MKDNKYLRNLPLGFHNAWSVFLFILLWFVNLGNFTEFSHLVSRITPVFQVVLRIGQDNVQKTFSTVILVWQF